MKIKPNLSKSNKINQIQTTSTKINRNTWKSNKSWL